MNESRLIALDTNSLICNKVIFDFTSTKHFQRVKISGEDSTGVPVEDLHTAANLLIKALEIREKYMNVSHQEFPSNVQR